MYKMCNLFSFLLFITYFHRCLLQYNYMDEIQTHFNSRQRERLILLLLRIFKNYLMTNIKDLTTFHL